MSSSPHELCSNDDHRALSKHLADPEFNPATNLTKKGETVLHASALYGALTCMKLILQDGRVDVNHGNQWGETALHHCAGSGDKNASKGCALLVEHGASLTAKDKWGRTPVSVAFEHQECRPASFFEKYMNENPDIKEEVTQLQKDYDSTYKNEIDGLMTAVANRQKKVADIKSQISGSGASEEVPPTGVNPMFRDLGSVQLKKTTTVVKTIFETGKAGGPVDNSSKQKQQESTNRTPLSKVIEHPPDLEAIREQLADSDIDPSGVDMFGLSALHKAASWNNVELIELLEPYLTKDDLAIKSADGDTALDLAKALGSALAEEKLLSLANTL